jgi:hypothetical protein
MTTSLALPDADVGALYHFAGVMETAAFELRLSVKPVSAGGLLVASAGAGGSASGETVLGVGSWRRAHVSDALRAAARCEVAARWCTAYADAVVSGRLKMQVFLAAQVELLAAVTLISFGAATPEMAVGMVEAEAAGVTGAAAVAAAVRQVVVQACEAFAARGAWANTGLFVKGAEWGAVWGVGGSTAESLVEGSVMDDVARVVDPLDQGGRGWRLAGQRAPAAAVFGAVTGGIFGVATGPAAGAVEGRTAQGIGAFTEEEATMYGLPEEPPTVFGGSSPSQMPNLPLAIDGDRANRWGGGIEFPLADRSGERFKIRMGWEKTPYLGNSASSLPGDMSWMIEPHSGPLTEQAVITHAQRAAKQLGLPTNTNPLRPLPRLGIEEWWPSDGIIVDPAVRSNPGKYFGTDLLKDQPWLADLPEVIPQPNISHLAEQLKTEGPLFVRSSLSPDEIRTQGGLLPGENGTIAATGHPGNALGLPGSGTHHPDAAVGEALPQYVYEVHPHGAHIAQDKNYVPMGDSLADWFSWTQENQWKPVSIESGHYTWTGQLDRPPVGGGDSFPTGPASRAEITHLIPLQNIRTGYTVENVPFGDTSAGFGESKVWRSQTGQIWWSNPFPEFNPRY